MSRSPSRPSTSPRSTHLKAVPDTGVEDRPEEARGGARAAGPACPPRLTEVPRERRWLQESRDSDDPEQDLMHRVLVAAPRERSQLDCDAANPPPPNDVA